MRRPTLRGRFRGLFIACLTVILTAVCSSGEAPGEPDPLASDSAGVRIHEFAPEVLTQTGALVLAAEPQVRIGVVDGPGPYQWTRPVAAARLEDGGFAVLEQTPGEIRLFDPRGRHLRTVSGPGDGPGELRAPTRLTVLPGDTLLVWDAVPRRLTWFSVQGEVLREQTVGEPGGIRSIQQVALSAGGEVIVLGPRSTVEEEGNQGRVRNRWEVVPLPTADQDPGGGAARSVGSVPGIERIVDVARDGGGDAMSVTVQGRWWWGTGFSWPAPGGVWTADQLSLEARHFDRTRGLDRVVRVQAIPRDFTPSLIDSLHAVKLEGVYDPELRALWQADFQDREYPRTVPPVASVFADLAGRVWLGLLDPPPETLPSGEHRGVRRWAVFQHDRGGTAHAMQSLGLVTLPERSHPLWADARGVLLVRNGAEFDIPFIEWYPYVDD